MALSPSNDIPVRPARRTRKERPSRPDLSYSNNFCPNLNTGSVSRGRSLQAGQGSILLPHKGEPGDIANAALFLMSDEGNYMTGQTLCMAGGAVMTP